MIKTTLATYIALNKINLSIKHIIHIEQNYADITQIFSFSNHDLINLGWNEKHIHQWQNLAWSSVEQELNWAAQPHHHILHWQDTSYPHLLKEIYSPPPLLYIKGNIDAIHQPILAVVGTRHPTEYGKQNAAYFSQKLAELGFCIASGLAIGIDGIAHQHALPFPSSTIAVVATGLDQIYPYRHQSLAARIIDNGALVSEFPFKTPPRPENFPRRNRIISGLSQGVLVIEAALKSGSLITARYAMEQGREVFAIPGIIQNPSTHGCHALIRQGAVLVNSVNDILEELGIEIISSEPTIIQAPTDESNVLQYLDYGVATSIDLLIARSGLSASEMTSELITLELSGTVSKTPEGYYRNIYTLRT